MFVRHKCLLSGLTEEHILIDNQTYYSLHNALLLATGCELNFIIVFKGVSVGIHRQDSSFYIFDSHSHDEYGTSSCNGRCILGVLHSIPELMAYFQLLPRSIGVSDCDTQFDLYIFKFNTTYRHNPFSVKILEYRMGFKTETIRKRKRQHDKSPELHGKLQPLLEKQPLPSCVDDRNVDSIPEKNSLCSVDTLISYRLDDSVISQFNKLVSSGPDYVCSCCTQTFLKRYMWKTYRMPIRILWVPYKKEECKQL